MNKGLGLILLSVLSFSSPTPTPSGPTLLKFRGHSRVQQLMSSRDKCFALRTTGSVLSPVSVVEGRSGGRASLPCPWPKLPYGRWGAGQGLWCSCFGVTHLCLCQQGLLLCAAQTDVGTTFLSVEAGKVEGYLPCQLEMVPSPSSPNHSKGGRYRLLPSQVFRTGPDPCPCLQGQLYCASQARVTVLSSAAAGEQLSQVPHLLQVASSKGRRAFPHPHHHMRNQKGTTCSPILSPLRASLSVSIWTGSALLCCPGDM